MRSLIVEDDFASRLLLQKLLMVHGEAHVAVNGREAVTAFRAAVEAAAGDRRLELPVILHCASSPFFECEISHIILVQTVIRCKAETAAKRIVPVPCITRKNSSAP